MNNNTKGNFFLLNKIGKIILYIVLILIALYTLVPVIFLILNSFKGQAEIVRDPLALPESLTFKYIANAFETIHFPSGVGHTVLITVCSITLIVLCSSFGGWMLARRKTKISSVVYMVFAAAMLIPFQAVMYPLLSMMDSLGLKNLPGLIIMYVGFGLSMSIFLYTGFFKSIPISLEEAAIIDGANIFRVFFRIDFPLVKSTTITIIILNGMWIWNDYLLPFMTLGTSGQKTLVLELYYARMQAGQFGDPWQLIFPAVLLSVIPMILAFLFLQKYFVKGVSEGAVKM